MSGFAAGSSLAIHGGMTKSRKTTIKAVSLIDLQLKLAKHHNWRVLEISRLGFGFKIVFQRRVEKRPQYVPTSFSQMPAIRRTASAITDFPHPQKRV
jgi:hypothetical protein